jgi:hypothetical protein
VFTDPGDSVVFRFFGKTTAQDPAEYGPLTGLSVPADVQWLSDPFTISISGVRTPPTLNQTITFPAFPSVHDTTDTLAATSSVPSLAVSYEVTAGTGCTVSGDQLTFGSTIGSTCTVRASQDGDGIYRAATSISKTVVVTKATQVIVFPTPAGPTYIGGHVTLTPADIYSSWTPPGGDVTPTGLGVSLSISGGCSMDANTMPAAPSDASVTVTFNSYSSCKVTAKQAGTAGYTAAQTVWSFDIAKVPQTITFNHPSQSVGAPAGKFLIGDHLLLTSSNLFASSGLPVTVAISGAGCTARTGTVDGANTVQIDFTAVGTCQVSATQPGTTTYATAPTINWSPRVVKP